MRILCMNRISSARAAVVLLPLMLLFAPSSMAHEEHRRDMTDAQAAQMKAEMPAHGAHGAGKMDAGTHGDMKASSPELTPEAAFENAIAANRVRSGGDFLGRLHPFVVHFPIALLLAAAFAEVFLIWRPVAGGQIIVRFLVAGGATGAVAAALLGWFAAGWRFSDRSETLALHRWSGTAIAAVSLAATWLAFRSGSRAALRAVILILAGALLAQGYLGGEMVFGPNHLGLF